jgi:hypothetical protein
MVRLFGALSALLITTTILSLVILGLIGYFQLSWPMGFPAGLFQPANSRFSA